MMKEIEINHSKYGKFLVKVDDEDYDWLMKKSWYISKESQTFYVKHDTKKNGKKLE